MSTGPPRDTFTRTHGTRGAGQAMTMKDFDRRRVLANNIVNYHIGSNDFRHISFPLNRLLT